MVDVDERAEKYASASTVALRDGILTRLGMNEARDTELSKSALNSLVAYLTGEFYVKPDDLHADDADPKGDLMDAVAQECNLTDWVEHYGDVLAGNVEQHRPWNTEELARILATMDARGDRREWAGDETGTLAE